jgi:ArsR family transcriptional regulator, arsenate/arsenite/antimonite-responsive transcriptional repressor
MSNDRSVNEEHYAEMFKALSNQHRLKIFLRLARCGNDGIACRPGSNCECVGDVGSSMDIAPSTLSHHLKELHRAGLIKSRRNGQRIECWVDPGTLGMLSDFFKNQA